MSGTKLDNSLRPFVSERVCSCMVKFWHAGSQMAPQLSVAVSSTFAAETGIIALLLLIGRFGTLVLAHAEKRSQLKKCMKDCCRPRRLLRRYPGRLRNFRRLVHPMLGPLLRSRRSLSITEVAEAGQGK